MTRTDTSAPTPAITEIDVDRAYDIVEHYEQVIEARGCCNDFHAEHQEHLVHLFMCGQVGDGFTEEVALDLARGLDERLRPHGWFVAKRAVLRNPDPVHDEDPQILCYVDAFPMTGVEQRVGNTLYHIAPTAARDAILRNGLKPSIGGNDHIITPNGRVYVVLHPVAVDPLAEDMRRLRGWTDMDVWRIDAAATPHRTWRRDVELADIGAWTADAIVPGHLVLERTILQSPTTESREEK